MLFVMSLQCSFRVSEPFLKVFTCGRNGCHRFASTFNPSSSYESTISNVDVKLNTPVLTMGTGKASQFHNKISQEFGTNIVGAVAPGRGGSTFLDRPVYGKVTEAVSELNPFAVSVFVPPQAAADAIIECIEAEVPLVVSVAEGIPTHDQLKVQSVLRSQWKSRLVGANSPGLIIPSAKFKLGIQPLSVHSPGRVGIASRSGTLSYELASQTTALGLGQSIVFGLGGDPFPGTTTCEALEWMLNDPATEIICIVGEIGGQMEEEAAAAVARYRSDPRNKPFKPMIGFIAGQLAERGRLHGHAGAIWYEDSESAANKIAMWRKAGITVADRLGDIGRLIKEAADEIQIGNL